MPPKPLLYYITNRELNGQLDQLLRTWRDAKVSAPAIGRLIEQATGHSISGQTIRRWLAELDEDANGEAA